MKAWKIVVLVGVVLAVVGGFAYWTFHRNDDRFGDPDVIAQIESSTDCAELQEWADGLLTADPADKEAFDLAVGYSNAASDRMDEIGC